MWSLAFWPVMFVLGVVGALAAIAGVRGVMREFPSEAEAADEKRRLGDFYVGAKDSPPPVAE